MVHYLLSLAINIFGYPTANDGPCTPVLAFIPMDCKRVILLIPPVETLATKETLDVVSSVPRGVEEETGLSERIRCCDEVGRMRPFEGECTLCCWMLYASGLCEGLETSGENFHRGQWLRGGRC